MGSSDLLQSKKWKRAMGFVYGFGAAIVIVGALFKIQHWPGGSVMLTIGMLVEVLLFIIGSFEPPHEQPHWEKVYPELGEDFVADENYYAAKGAQASAGGGQVSVSGILEGSGVSEDVMKNVSHSLKELGNTAKSFADISNATLATDVYVRNLNSASESMSAFAEINTRASETIDKSMGELVDSYAETSSALTNSTKEISDSVIATSKKLSSQIEDSSTKLVSSYKSFSDSIGQDFDTLNKEAKTYGTQLSSINENLAALNASYESQLKGSNQYLESTKVIYDQFETINQTIVNSAEEAKKYQANAQQLNQNLSALNDVYGNMLGAMNVKN